jgi:CRISPR-associated endonuclease Cas1
MIHHLILVSEHSDLHVQAGRLISGSNKIAIETLGSVQCFAAQARWSQTALESLASQCPVVMARWDKAEGKWRTFSLTPKARHVNPTALWQVCRLTERRATVLASDLIFAKVRNQHAMLRVFDPYVQDLPRLADNSFSRILRLEARYARFFWARYFAAVAQDLFEREKRKAQAPLNVALNYGYGFLYHALEWQCLAGGLDPTIGIIHKLRRQRPSLVCDLIEPFRCCVELTLVRRMDEMHDKKAMAARFAEMIEEKWQYEGRSFRLRTIIRLSVESFIRALNGGQRFAPFQLHPRDACV